VSCSFILPCLTSIKAHSLMQQRTHKSQAFSTHRSTQTETLRTDANTNSTSGLILFPTLADQDEGLLAGNCNMNPSRRWPRHSSSSSWVVDPLASGEPMHSRQTHPNGSLHRPPDFMAPPVAGLDLLAPSISERFRLSQSWRLTYSAQTYFCIDS